MQTNEVRVCPVLSTRPWEVTGMASDNSSLTQEVADSGVENPATSRNGRRQNMAKKKKKKMKM